MFIAVTIRNDENIDDADDVDDGFCGCCFFAAVVCDAENIDDDYCDHFLLLLLLFVYDENVDVHDVDDAAAVCDNENIDDDDDDDDNNDDYFDNFCFRLCSSYETTLMNYVPNQK